MSGPGLEKKMFEALRGKKKKRLLPSLLPFQLASRDYVLLRRNLRFGFFFRRQLVDLFAWRSVATNKKKILNKFDLSRPWAGILSKVGPTSIRVG
jgi:hypothetical protein